MTKKRSSEILGDEAEFFPWKGQSKYVRPQTQRQVSAYGIVGIFPWFFHIHKFFYFWKVTTLESAFISCSCTVYIIGYNIILWRPHNCPTIPPPKICGSRPQPSRIDVCAVWYLCIAEIDFMFLD